jgi:hypothetical protein
MRTDHCDLVAMVFDQSANSRDMGADDALGDRCWEQIESMEFLWKVVRVGGMQM